MKEKAGVPEAKPLETTASGVPIRGELFRPPPHGLFSGGQRKKLLLVMCHGIPAGPQEPGRRKRGYRFWAGLLARKGYPVATFNFRGTGESGGNLNIKEWCSDLQAVLEWCQAETGPDFKGAALVGFSAGAAAAVEVGAVDQRVKAIALAACPANFNFLFEKSNTGRVIKWMRATGLFRDGNYPPHQEGWKKDFLSVKPERSIGLFSPRPLLIMHGERDDLVLPWHARRLYRRAGRPKRLHLFSSYGHRLRRHPRVFTVILGWLEEALREQLL